MVRKRSVALVGLALIALLLGVGVALAYEHPQTAPSVQASLVPNFKQCGPSNGTNPPNAQHSPPLAAHSCNPPQLFQATGPVIGAAGEGTATYSALVGDVGVQVAISDVETTAGADWDPNGAAGGDLQVAMRGRVTDIASCSPMFCSGPYDQPATGTDVDMGPVAFDCVPNGSPASPPGSDCAVTTTMNAFFAMTYFEPGRQTVIQLFRTRVLNRSNISVMQQGVFVP
jgi:hypothetical protein